MTGKEKAAYWKNVGRLKKENEQIRKAARQKPSGPRYPVKVIPIARNLRYV